MNKLREETSQTILHILGSEAGSFVARFEGVQPGSFVLRVRPVHDGHLFGALLDVLPAKIMAEHPAVGSWLLVRGEPSADGAIRAAEVEPLPFNRLAYVTVTEVGKPASGGGSYLSADDLAVRYLVES